MVTYKVLQLKKKLKPICFICTINEIYNLHNFKRLDCRKEDVRHSLEENFEFGGFHI